MRFAEFQEEAGSVAKDKGEREALELWKILQYFWEEDFWEGAGKVAN